MKGFAECLFVGGPGGDVVHTLPAIQCVDRLALEQECWLEARADGGANVMRGRRPLDANWEAYTLAVYEKDAPTAAGGVTYRFQEVQAVSRCRATVKLENLRCKHPALDGEQFCRQHKKK